MMRFALAGWFALAMVHAQAPAPAGESGPDAGFRAAEAQAADRVRAIAADWRLGRPAWTDWQDQHLMVEHYRQVRFEFGGGELVCVEQDNSDPRTFYRPGDCLLFFVPRDAEATRMFCVRGDGVVAFTANEARCESVAEVLFADGGVDELAKFPRSPTKAADGNFWLPGAMLERTAVHVMVVDDRGDPHGMERLEFAPAPADVALREPLPATRFLTTREGSVQVDGVAVRGLGVRLDRGNLSLWIDPERVAVRGNSVRVVVERAVLREFQMRRNEAAAIATLKNISSAQAQCQASAAVDVNGNGQGEYGMFGELSGRVRLRGGDRSMSPPVLSAAFGNIEGGVAVRSGYVFRMFLPDADAKPVPEADGGGAADLPVDARQAELLWCCYAWPVEVGVSGRRALFVNQSGDVLACSNEDGDWSGPATGPPPAAAFLDASSLSTRTAANRDGIAGHWRVVH